MRAVESEAGDAGAGGDQRIAQLRNPVARLERQRADRVVDVGKRNDLRDAVDRQADSGEAKPAPRQPFAVTEPRRREVDAREGGQEPASSAGSAAIVAMARSVEPIAASVA